MEWYLAKVVFQIICGDGDHTPQFDEQLRVVCATNKDEAFFKAQETGKQEQETFYNRQDQLVQWQFINVSELYRLGELIDGAEVYSRIEERDNPDQYIRIVHEKADSIRFSASHQLLQLA